MSVDPFLTNLAELPQPQKTDDVVGFTVPVWDRECGDCVSGYLLSVQRGVGGVTSIIIRLPTGRKPSPGRDEEFVPPAGDSLSGLWASIDPTSTEVCLVDEYTAFFLSGKLG